MSSTSVLSWAFNRLIKGYGLDLRAPAKPDLDLSNDVIEHSLQKVAAMMTQFAFTADWKSRFGDMLDLRGGPLGALPHGIIDTFDGPLPYRVGFVSTSNIGETGTLKAICCFSTLGGG